LAASLSAGTEKASKAATNMKTTAPLASVLKLTPISIAAPNKTGAAAVALMTMGEVNERIAPPNVAGVIGSAVAAGIMIKLLA
jgi:hypothetical protein